MDGTLGRPCAVLEARYVDVANLAGAAIAKRREHAVLGYGRSRGTALAHPRVHGSLRRLLPVAIEAPEVEGHCAAVRVRGVQLLVAPVEPDEAQTRVGHLEE